MAIGLLVMGVAIPPASAATTALAAPSFTWKMVDRTQIVYNSEFAGDMPVQHRMVKGPDGGPGMYSGLGYYGVSSVPVDQINPTGGFPVSFDGCAPVNAWATTFEWSVDGTPVAGLTTCAATTNLPEGTHTVTLTASGNGSVATTTQTIKVDDILVVNMGDSYSSGEGNPQKFVPGTPDDTVATVKANSGKGWHEGGLWDNAPCNRSSRGGQVQAAIDLEQSDPHTSVTLLNVACSGGEIDDGIVGDQNKPMMIPDPADPTETKEDPNIQPPQVTQVKDLAQGRQVDAVTLGIGGNDVGFVPIIMECVLNDDCFLDTDALASLTGRSIDPDQTGTNITDQQYRPANAAALQTWKLTGEPASPPAQGFTLGKKVLHRCQTVIHKEVLTDGANGGAVADADCSDRDYNSEPVGLQQTATCLVGPGTCTPLQGAPFPSLNVAPDHVFYTDYPDLTKHFVNGVPEFCSVTLQASSVEALLRRIVTALPDGNPVKAKLQTILTALSLGIASGAVPDFIGLSQSEMIWADQSVLGGNITAATWPYTPVSNVVPLTVDWKVKLAGGLTAPTLTIGPSNTQSPKVDFVNLVTSEPTLGEITKLAGQLYGWSSVSVYDGATGHGLCAPAANPVNRDVASYIYLTEALPVPLVGNKTNASGMAHPNLYGQQLYQQRIAAAMLPKFAPATVNLPAKAAPAVVTTKPGTAVGVDLNALGNSDPESDAITYAIATQPQHGTATINGGQITYTPQTGYQGSDQLIYSATDAGSGQVATASVSLTVASNLPPTVQSTSVNAAFQTPTTVDFGPLASDPDGDPVTFSISGQPQHGTLSAVTGSTVTYTPADGYTGPDSFTYQASDPSGASATGTVSVTVSPIPPRGERVRVMTKNLYLGADINPALSLLPNIGAAGQFMWDQVAATNFTARVPHLADEVLRERPDVLGLQEATTWKCQKDAQSDPVDIFNFTDQFLTAMQGEYVIASAGGQQAFNPGFSIGPIAVGPVTSTVTDPTIFQPIFGQDTAICGFTVADALLVHRDLAGSVTAVGTGDYTDKVIDLSVLSLVRGYSWADVTINGINARFATTQLESLFPDDDVTTGYKQAQQLISELSAVTKPMIAMGDFNSDPRDPRPVGAPNPADQPSANAYCPAQVANPTPATASPICNAYWSMIKDGGYTDSGPDAQDPANYTWGASALLAGPDLERIAPSLAMGNPYGLTERLDYVLLRNDVVATSAKITGNQWPNGPDVWRCDDPQQVANSTAAARDLGTTVNGGVCYPTDHSSVVADLVLLVPNKPPAAADTTATTPFQTPVEVNLAPLATDPEGDPVTLSITTSPQHGTLSAIAGGKVTYTPAAGYNGQDSFVFQASDPQGATDAGTVTITVGAPPNQPPTAADTTATTLFGQPVDIDLSGLASDPEGGALTFTVAAQPAHGTAAISPSGSAVTYTPAAGYSGSDTFTYQVVDNAGGTATGTITMTVQQNQAPTAGDGSVSAGFETPVDIDLGTLAGDPEGGALSFSITKQPQHGALSAIEGGIVTYTPAPGYSGADSFEYEAADAAGATTTGSVSITVGQAPPAPPPPATPPATGPAVPPAHGDATSPEDDADGLAGTGANVGGLVGIALLCLLAGAGVVGLALRSRRGESA